MVPARRWPALPVLMVQGSDLGGWHKPTAGMSQVRKEPRRVEYAFRVDVQWLILRGSSSRARSAIVRPAALRSCRETDSDAPPRRRAALEGAVALWADSLALQGHVIFCASIARSGGEEVGIVTRERGA